MLRVRNFGKFRIIGKPQKKGVASTCTSYHHRSCLESAQAVYIEMGNGAKLESFVNPSTEIMKSRPGLIEVSLRGSAVVSQPSKIKYCI